MTDSYGRQITYLRLSVTELCDLRCRYCMPEEGVCKRSHDEMLTEDEMIAAVRAAASLGVTKVRVTGGEPLTKPNIVSICRRVAAVAGIREVDITTNALRLPELAQPLWEAGVRRVNISLDTLDPERYAFITRRGHLADAWAGIEAALAAGFDGDTLFGEAAYIPARRVLELLPEAVPCAGHDGVARLYRLPGAQGEIGLISPLSNHFCGECNRLRLTADGHVKPCLHSAEELSVKGLDEDGMREVFLRAIAAKPRQHGALSAHDPSRSARTMNRIGG